MFSKVVGLNYANKFYVGQFYKSVFTLIDKKRYICADLWDDEISLFEQDDKNQIKIKGAARHHITLTPEK